MVHDDQWRDAETGWHSNDIESEFNRLKHWSRARNGILRITELDSFYINGGNEMDAIMKAFRYAADVPNRHPPIL